MLSSIVMVWLVILKIWSVIMLSSSLIIGVII